MVNSLVKFVANILWITERISSGFRREFLKNIIASRKKDPLLLLEPTMSKYLGDRKPCSIKDNSSPSQSSEKTHESLDSKNNCQQDNKEEFIKKSIRAILLDEISLQSARIGKNKFSIFFADGVAYARSEANEQRRKEKLKELKHMSYTAVIYAYFSLSHLAMVISYSGRTSKKQIMSVIDSVTAAADTIIYNFFPKDFQHAVMRLTKDLHKLRLKIFPTDPSFLKLLQSSERPEIILVPETSLNLPDAGPINDKCFQELVAEKYACRMSLPLTWKAFKKWNFQYFFKDHGFNRIRIRYGTGDPKISLLGSFIKSLLTEENDLPSCYIESFEKLPSLYDDCLPRPFPMLKNFWLNAQEFIIIFKKLKPKKFQSSRHTLFILIFGSCLVLAKHEGAGKHSLLMPKQAIYFPPNFTCHITAMNGSCFKMFQWSPVPNNYQIKEEDVPEWIRKSDRRSARLLKKERRSIDRKMTKC